MRKGKREARGPPAECAKNTTLTSSLATSIVVWPRAVCVLPVVGSAVAAAKAISAVTANAENEVLALAGGSGWWIGALGVPVQAL